MATYLWDSNRRTASAARAGNPKGEAIRFVKFSFAALRGLHTLLKQDDVVQLSVEDIQKLIIVRTPFSSGASRASFIWPFDGARIIGVQTAAYCPA